MWYCAIISKVLSCFLANLRLLSALCQSLYYRRHARLQRSALTAHPAAPAVGPCSHPGDGAVAAGTASEAPLTLAPIAGDRLRDTDAMPSDVFAGIVSARRVCQLLPGSVHHDIMPPATLTLPPPGVPPPCMSSGARARTACMTPSPKLCSSQITWSCLL